MISGETRREQILQALRSSPTPLSGTALARTCGVSRQVIVQDIALLRAEDNPILSTNKGYLYRPPNARDQRPKRVFRVRHTTAQVPEEFLTITELGGRVLDVAVEHELYGCIRVDLLIESPEDARDFSRRLLACRDNPLKALSDDCHYHTVSAPSEKLLDIIEVELKAKGFLWP